MSKHDDEVVLKRNKVYTSYFARASKIVPDRRLVSISLGTPEGWRGRYYRDLNPSKSLLFAYKSGSISDAEYEETYKFETLSRLNPNEVMEDLKGCVLCCWEKSGEFCHRHLVMKWLAENLGSEFIGGEI